MMFAKIIIICLLILAAEILGLIVWNEVRR